MNKMVSSQELLDMTDAEYAEWCGCTLEELYAAWDEEEREIAAYLSNQERV